jgi:hypothetical protein
VPTRTQAKLSQSKHLLSRDITRDTLVDVPIILMGRPLSAIAIDVIRPGVFRLQQCSVAEFALFCGPHSRSDIACFKRWR